MSREEAESMPLRELVRINLETMNAHAKESSVFRAEMKEVMAEIKTHNIYTKEKLGEHAEDIKKHNKFMWGAIGLGGVSLIGSIKSFFGL